MQLQLPARIGKYELTEYLGGGMSQVFRAQDTVLNRAVALKILSEQGNADTDARARFLEEARTACRLSHENIISVFDFGEERGRPFIVMEFLTGESLREAIKQGHTGDLQQQLQIALQTARALQYIHTQKIIHRDIKPDNLNIAPNGKVKLMDFGIAKSEGTNLTRAGFILGTPYYMAPEQVMGKPLTPLVDIYSFGVMLYEVLTGIRPVTGPTIERIFTQILHEPLDLEPLRRRHLPPALINLVERCTSKSPADRPASFEVVCAELERMLLPTGQHAAPTAQVPAPAMEEGLPEFMTYFPKPLQNTMGLVLASGVVVFVILVVIWVLARAVLGR